MIAQLLDRMFGNSGTEKQQIVATFIILIGGVVGALALGMLIFFAWWLGVPLLLLIAHRAVRYALRPNDSTASKEREQ